MNANAAEIASLIVAGICISLLVVLRVFVFRWCAQAHGIDFRVSPSLRKLLQVLGSLAIPGLGQVTQGRFEAAACHLLFVSVTWCFAGWHAFSVHFFSALECAATGWRRFRS